jgi:hypothetical protein
MKAFILAALIGIAAANVHAATYHAPAYNYNQNSWMSE